MGACPETAAKLVISLGLLRRICFLGGTNKLINKNLKRMIVKIRRKDAFVFISLYGSLERVLPIPLESWLASIVLQKKLLNFFECLTTTDKNVVRAIEIIQETYRLLFPMQNSNLIYISDYKQIKEY